MKTLNKIFLDKKDLQEFIIKNKIVENKNILLQIFTAVTEVEFIENLIQSIKEQQLGMLLKALRKS